MDGGGQEDLEEDYNQWVPAVKSSLEEEIGRKSGRAPRKICNKLRRAIKKRRKAAAKWRKRCIAGKNADRAWEQYSQIKKETSRRYWESVRKHKEEWATKVCKEGGASSRTLWYEIQTKEQGLQGVRQEGTTVTDPEKILEAVGDYFRNLGTQDTPDPDPNTATNTPHTSTVRNTDTQTSIVADEIQTAEIEEIIKKLPNRSSMGPDRINNLSLKRGGEAITRSLKTLFNHMLHQGWTPEAWNEEWVALIHKGKSRLELDNYRGIALSSCVGKVLTKILAHRLRNAAETHHWLPEAQAAFRKDRCVEDHIFTVRALVAKSKRSKNTLLAVFLDLKKAFDSVNRQALWKKLSSLGLDAASINTLKGLYHNHTRRIRVGKETTNPHTCHKGVRQGCPLSPILFNLFTQDLPGKVNLAGEGIELGNTKITMLCYADDIMLVSSNLVDLEKITRRTIEELNNRGLKINYNKCALMTLSKGRKNPITPSLRPTNLWKVRKTNGDTLGEIKIVEEYRYLGITLHTKNLFKSHREKKANTMKLKLGILKARCGQTEDRTLTGKAMWSGMITKGTLFGSNVIDTPKKWLSDLDKTHAQAARWIIGASPKTSTERSLRELDWSSMEQDAALSKICLHARILKMTEDRWPKLALAEMMSWGSNSKWVTEIEGIKLKYKLKQNIITTHDHGPRLRSWIKYGTDLTDQTQTEPSNENGTTPPHLDDDQPQETHSSHSSTTNPTHPAARPNQQPTTPTPNNPTVHDSQQPSTSTSTQPTARHSHQPPTATPPNATVHHSQQPSTSASTIRTTRGQQHQAPTATTHPEDQQPTVIHMPQTPPVCQHQPPKNEPTGKDYLGSFLNKLWVRRARAQDWWQLTGGQPPNTCPLCSRQSDCIINHIISHEGSCWEAQTPQNDINCEALWSSPHESQLSINRWIRKWVLKREQQA